MAEREGFEPPSPCGLTVFKTAAFNRSATSPRGAFSESCAGDATEAASLRRRRSSFLGDPLLESRACGAGISAARTRIDEDVGLASGLPRELLLHAEEAWMRRQQDVARQCLDGADASLVAFYDRRRVRTASEMEV